MTSDCPCRTHLRGAVSCAEDRPPARPVSPPSWGNLVEGHGKPRITRQCGTIPFPVSPPPFARQQIMSHALAILKSIYYLLNPQTRNEPHKYPTAITLGATAGTDIQALTSETPAGRSHVPVKRNRLRKALDQPYDRDMAALNLRARGRQSGAKEIPDPRHPGVQSGSIEARSPSMFHRVHAQRIKHPQRCVSDQCVRHLQAGDLCPTSYKGTKSPAHACPPHFAQN